MKPKNKKNVIGKTPVDNDLIFKALSEDAPDGDITTEATIPEDATCAARLIAKQDLTLAGIEMFEAVFKYLYPGVKIKKYFKDGDDVKSGETVARVDGLTQAILTAERVALNFLQRLSGIATLTAKYVQAVEGTGSVILDTRKTTPGMRELEKYAVRCGSGKNHRRNLSEMALIKENHIAGAGGITQAVERVRAVHGKKTMVEVEARNYKELEEALTAGADRILLDNMTPRQVSKAFEICAGRAELEASGNVNLKNVRSFAEAGVDYISIGALTHSAPAADFSLLLENVK